MFVVVGTVLILIAMGLLVTGYSPALDPYPVLVIVGAGLLLYGTYLLLN